MSRSSAIAAHSSGTAAFATGIRCRVGADRRLVILRVSSLTEHLARAARAPRIRVRCCLALAAGTALVGFASAAIATGDAGQASTAEFVRRYGTHLLLGERPFLFTGLNMYNANSDGSCWYAMKSGRALARSLSAVRGQNRVIRAWFFQNMATKHGARDWTAFDHTLAAARAAGVKVIPVLTNQWSSCDAAAGHKDVEWYTTGYKRLEPRGLVSYRSWAAEVASRYKADPTILAWQLINEGGVANADRTCPRNAATIFKRWAADVSGVIKSIDPKHLISLGTGGGSCGTKGRDYRDVHDLPTIDLCEYHDYSGLRPLPGDHRNGLSARIAQCKQLDKPLFVGESGIRLDAVESPGSRAAVFDAKFRAQFAAGVVGELVWNWNLRGSHAAFDVGPGDPTLAVLAQYSPP